MKLKTYIFFLILVPYVIFSQNIERVGFVSSVEGSCQAKNNQLGRSSYPIIGNSIFNYDIISSGYDSYCEITFDDFATRIRIDGDTQIKLITDDYSRIIKIINGSIFIESAKIKDKLYVQTLHNDIYIDNNNAWISSSLLEDKVFSIDSQLNIYNNFINSEIVLTPLILYAIDKMGNVQSNYNFELPYYVSKRGYIQEDKNNTETVDLFIDGSDLIPLYKLKKEKKISSDNGFYFNLTTGPRYMDSETYFNVGLFPAYKYNNLTITAKLDFYIDSEQNFLQKNWTDKTDILEKINLRYHYIDYKNSIDLYAGEIQEVDFGYGYLVRKLSNSFDSPFNNFGININYKLDNDFMEFQFLIPSTRDFYRNGGIFGFHSSLFLSHKFPLTLGLGIITDMNQFSQARYIHDFPEGLSLNLDKRNVTGLGFDFNFNIIKKMRLDVSLYGELVGMWYPDYIHYVRNTGTGGFGSLTKVSRKGTWGMMAPGIAIKFNNRYEIKFALNYNSAGHYPSYFNTNYLYNRAIYYKTDQPLDFNNQNFILLSDQIEMLNNFAINDELTEFLLPKEIYPMLLNKFNASDVRGFTIEGNYAFKNKVEFSALFSRYEQNISLSPNFVYYTVESNISIKDGYIKNISNFDFYLQNIFFIGDQDKQELTMGFNMGIEITPIISLILDFSQVYYDSNLDGDISHSANFGLNLGANF